MPLEERSNRYYAYLDVPADVREKIGRRVFRQTLKTDSKRVAERRAAPLVTRWKGEIERARGNTSHDDAAFYRDLLRSAQTPERRQAVLDQVEMAALDRAGEFLWKDVPADDPARAFYAEATGLAAATDEFVDDWLKGAKVKAKTETMRRGTIARLKERFPLVRDIKRPEVVRWAAELQEAAAGATVQRMMSDCRSYWRYLQSVEMAPKDAKPFDDLGVKVRYSSWKPYTAEEVARLLSAAESDRELWDVMMIAAHHGARREEICALKVDHVKPDRFDIIDAKTPDGVRAVPIHSATKAIFKRLAGKRKTGFLFAGFEANGNGDRGDAIGKRFSALKTGLGFGGAYTFHSLRKTFVTEMERAGVPEPTTQDIIGHRRSTLTGSTYSGKSTFVMRRDAIERVHYPPN